MGSALQTSIRARVLSVESWRRMAACCQSGNCVEVPATCRGLVAVRDSKEPEGAWLLVLRAAWRVFVRNVQDAATIML